MLCVPLTNDQSAVYEFVRRHPNTHVFIHGPAGTGKSIIRDKIIENTSALVLGPTGISVDKCMGSMTIARFCLSPPREVPHTLIIEEAGMVTSSEFDRLESTCRLNGGGFSKRRLILVLDLCQMPPIGESYFFESKIWKRVSRKLHVFNLTQNLRVTDLDAESRDEFLFFLGRLRDGTFHSSPRATGLLDYVISRKVIKQDAIWLCTTNELADRINEERIGKVQSNVFTMYNKVNERSFSGFIGARVQVTKNMYSKHTKTLVAANGSIGTIIDVNGADTGITKITSKGCSISLKLDDGRVIEMKPVKDDRGELYFGLTLAYALTLHRAQGLSFDSVVVARDASTRALTLSEAYTAFSRSRSLHGVSVHNVNSYSISVTDRKCREKMIQMGLS